MAALTEAFGLQAYIPDHIADARRAAGRILVFLLWLHVPALTAAMLAGLASGRPALLASVMALFATWLWWRREGASRAVQRASRLGIAACLATTVSASGASLARGLATAGIGAYGTSAYELAAVAALCGLLDRQALGVGVAVLLAGQAALLLRTEPFGAALAQALPLAAMLVPAVAAWLWLIGQLNRTVAVAEAESKDAAQSSAAMEQALRLAAEAATDLSAQAAEDRVAHQFEQEIGALASNAAHAAEGVRTASSQITEVSEETARRTLTIADSSRDTVASARTVATSVDDLAASIATVTANVREVSDASFRAMDEATVANDTVKKLSDAALRIGHVVRVINTIARKTNMLALNATIEATRAGAAGLGFSVVAAEVKALAQQTAAATGDIEQEITTIGMEISHAVAAIDGMAQTVAQLGGSTVQAACVIDEQAEIAHSIAASAMRAADGTHEVVTNLDALTEASSRAEAAARACSHDAKRLADECAGVETTVKAFVKGLLTA